MRERSCPCRNASFSEQATHRTFNDDAICNTCRAAEARDRSVVTPARVSATPQQGAAPGSPATRGAVTRSEPTHSPAGVSSPLDAARTGRGSSFERIDRAAWLALGRVHQSVVQRPVTARPPAGR